MNIKRKYQYFIIALFFLKAYTCYAGRIDESTLRNRLHAYEAIATQCYTHTTLKKLQKMSESSYRYFCELACDTYWDVWEEWLFCIQNMRNYSGESTVFKQLQEISITLYTVSESLEASQERLKEVEFYFYPYEQVPLLNFQEDYEDLW